MFGPWYVTLLRSCNQSWDTFATNHACQISSCHMFKKITQLGFLIFIIVTMNVRTNNSIGRCSILLI